MFEHCPNLGFGQFLSEKLISREAQYCYLNIYCINIAELETLNIEKIKY